MIMRIVFICRDWYVNDRGIAMARKPRILVVDDQPEIVDLLVSCLEGKGYDLVTAYDGETALTKARRGDIDLILLDVMMPGKDGFEVCRELKADEDTRNIAVIFVTARGEVEDVTSGFELGAVDYVSKPFDVPVIVARVNSAVRSKVLHDELRQRNFLLRDFTYTDETTGLRNSRYFDERLSEEMEKARRYGFPLTCLAIEIDDFDKIIESTGEDAMDDVIADVAMVIRSHTRSFDIVAAQGGQMFAIVLPHTSADEAVAYGANIRNEIGARTFLGGPIKPVQVSVSIGAAAFSPEITHSSEEFFAVATGALEIAKTDSESGIHAAEHAAA